MDKFIRSSDLTFKFDISDETVKYIRKIYDIKCKMTVDEANFVMSKTRIFKYRIGYNSIYVMEKLLFHWSPSLIAKDLNTSKKRVLEVLEEWQENENIITVESKLNYMI